MNHYYGLKPGVITEQERRHAEIVRDIAARGMVLLEHDGTLPLQKGTKIALYGAGARNTVFCGLGAASFVSREEVTIEEGLKRAGLIITSEAYLERYAAILAAEEERYYRPLQEAAKDGLIQGVIRMYEKPFVPGPQPLITEEDLREASGAETAVYVVSRVAGEGADRKNEEGDYLLSSEEKENLRILSGRFRRVIVLLNVGAPMDTSFFRSLPNLGALLLTGQAAGVTGLAAADVLTGRVVPEGKLSDTWAEKYSDYPSADTFAAMNGNLDDEFYREGIYVGYRYFDSFGITPAYPFGFGLSYTSFSIAAENIWKEEGERLSVRASVTNTGDRYAGREVVQLYVSPPADGMEKPYQELKGFARTGLLAPGETQVLEIPVEIRNLACYSEERAAWILEAGDYVIRVGNSSRNTRAAAILRVKEEILCEQCRNLCVPEEEMKELTGRISRQKEDFSGIPVIGVTQAEIACRQNIYRQPLWETGKASEEAGTDGMTENSRMPEGLRYEDVRDGHISLDRLVKDLTVEEMTRLCVGNADGEDATFVTYGSGNTQTEAVVPMAPGTCDSTRSLLRDRGIPNMHMSDGGSGLRLLTRFETDQKGNLLTEGVLSVRNVDRLLEQDYITGGDGCQVSEQYTTGLPMATLLAQTWDRECWRQCGEIEGREMQQFHVELWLAPSMNIHRNPLCGRNFEYYSEDPLLTGECAAAVIHGLQSFRRAGVTMKHFACNNQEDNRHGVNVHISERALREIYLRGQGRVGL